MSESLCYFSSFTLFNETMNINSHTNFNRATNILQTFHLTCLIFFVLTLKNVPLPQYRSYVCTCASESEYVYVCACVMVGRDDSELRK